MATYYAWSPIHYHDKDGNKKIVQPGEEVSADLLALDKDSWKELRESGSVRKEEYPKGLNPKNPNALSPNEHRLRSLRLERERLELEMAGAGGSSTAEENAEAQKNEPQSRIP